MPSEKLALEKIAEQRGSSLNKTIREAVVLGLQIMRNSPLSSSATTTSPTPTVAELSGGEAPASTAAFSSPSTAA